MIDEVRDAGEDLLELTEDERAIVLFLRAMPLERGEVLRRLAIPAPGAVPPLGAVLPLGQELQENLCRVAEDSLSGEVLTPKNRG